MSKQERTAKEYAISDDLYFPSVTKKRTKMLPADVYELNHTSEGLLFLKPIDIVTDNIIEIPNSITGQTVNEIKEFWSNSVTEKFKQYGLVQKRGIMLYGKPGTGKTVTLAMVARSAIEMGAIVIFNPSPYLLVETVRLVKEIEPAKKVLVMWEEFDSLIRGEESVLLSLLDGEIQLENIVYLATTNYITRIPSRIKNRPSRFATVIEVKEPDVDARRMFFQQKLHSSDKAQVENFVTFSEGMVIDQMKDLIISVCCFNQSMAEAVKKIKDMEKDSVGHDDYYENNASQTFKILAPATKAHVPLKPIK